MKRIIFLIVLTILITNCTKDEFIQNDQFIDDIELDTRGQKIDVCHNGNIINVSINAVSAHEAHGDAVDMDGDGYFDALNDCIEGVDCNDADPNINPDAEEVPYNGVDDDCNAATPDDDLDGDGFVNADDCNDNNFDINPGAAEVCDNDIDDNCNGEVDEDCGYIIGQYYEALGGIVVALEGDGGLVAKDMDEVSAYNWFEAISHCSGLTDGGFDDWYLPSRLQLNMMYEIKDDIGGFSDDYYWSSDIIAGRRRVFGARQNFSDGTYSAVDRNNNFHYVRAVRNF